MASSFQPYPYMQPIIRVCGREKKMLNLRSSLKLEPARGFVKLES